MPDHSEQSSTSKAEVADLLNLCRQAAACGAHILKAAASRDISIQSKSSLGDLVTEVDLAAERAIREFLSELRPNDLLVGEEFPDSDTSNPRYRWLIDPLDGTNNFAKSLPHFGTSIGVQEIASGRWLAGAVNAPILGKEYYASAGQGAWLEQFGQRRQLHGPDPEFPSQILASGVSYDADLRMEQLAALPALMENFNGFRAIGSAALALCLLAEGSFDAYVESDLYIYDWAAGALIAEEAGVVVRRPEGHRGGLSAYPVHLLPDAAR
ncbi:MAG: inositol monophosphatase family protein [Microbacteriaceae bacterium]